MDIFGGSKSKSQSSSSNQAFDFIKNTFSPVAGMAGGASNALAGLLGIGGDPAAAAAGFQNYLGSTGYQFQLGQGLQALTANNATKGLLNSGAALKGAQQYGQGLASNYFQNYLQQLGGLGEMGLGAGQLIAGAGQTSQSSEKGSSSRGIFQSIPLFSDVRLKKNIRHVATDENGIRYHEWEWNDDARDKYGLEGEGFGVLAQELMKTPFLTAIDTIDGYFTVHYGELPEPQELREVA